MAKTEPTPLEVIMGDDRIEVKLDDRSYTVAPLDVNDFSEFRSWVKKRRMSMFVEVARDTTLPPKMFAAGIERILSAAADEDGGDPVLSDMSTEEGLRYLLWLGIRKEHPDVKLEDFRIRFPDVAPLIQVFARISGFTIPDTARTCQSCDKAIADDKAKFCLHCGGELSAVNPTAIPETTETTEEASPTTS